MASFQQLNAMAEALPLGKYAIMGKDGETPYFFEIAEVKNTKRIFRLHGSPGDYKRETLNIKWQHYALHCITEDTIGCFALYGKHAKFCGVCDSSLTKKKSLDRGVGPVCWINLTKGQ